MVFDEREGESGAERDARLMNEYMELGKEVGRITDLGELRTSNRYRRFIHIGDYLRTLNGEQIIKALDYDLFR